MFFEVLSQPSKPLAANFQNCWTWYHWWSKKGFRGVEVWYASAKKSISQAKSMGVMCKIIPTKLLCESTLKKNIWQPSWQPSWTVAAIKEHSMKDQETKY